MKWQKRHWWLLHAHSILHREIMKTTLSAQDKERLVDWDNSGELEPVDQQELFMDSHGCNVVLVVVRKIGTVTPLYGFTYRYSSEQRFYEDDPMELIEVKPREVVKVEFDRVDGDCWSEHC